MASDVIGDTECCNLLKKTSSDWLSPIPQQRLLLKYAPCVAITFFCFVDSTHIRDCECLPAKKTETHTCNAIGCNRDVITSDRTVSAACQMCAHMPCSFFSRDPFAACSRDACTVTKSGQQLWHEVLLNMCGCRGRGVATLRTRIRTLWFGAAK